MWVSLESFIFEDELDDDIRIYVALTEKLSAGPTAIAIVRACDGVCLYLLIAIHGDASKVLIRGYLGGKLKCKLLRRSWFC